MLVLLLTLIFSRPFIASLAFPYLNFAYSTVFLGFLIIWFIKKGLPLKKIAALKIPLSLFLLALFISIIFSINKINSLKELYKYISGISIFLVIISLDYEDKIRVIKVIILSGFLISLLAINQYFFGFCHLVDYLARNQIASPFAMDYIQQKRVFFPFVTPSILGGYLIMMIPLILAFWDKKPKAFLSPLLFVFLSISFALLLTKSLGALLSIFFGLIIYFYLQKILDKKRLLFIAGFLFVIGLIFFGRQTAAKQHILPSFSLIMRINYWESSLRIIKTVLWTGIGLGNFNFVFSRYTHNSYLQIWAEMGILGILSFLWLIIAVFKYAFENAKASSNNKLLTGLITANAVFLIHNLIDFSFFLPEVVLIWWIILGLSMQKPRSKLEESIN